MATVPELNEAYRTLLLRICATGYKNDGDEVDEDKIWRIFCKAAWKSNQEVGVAEQMTLEQFNDSLRTFDICNDAYKIIEDEIERLSKVEAQ